MGFRQSKVYRTEVRNLAVLKQRISEACAMITVAMLQKVFRATVTCWESCFEMDDGHVEREQPCVCCNILYVVLELLFPKNVLGLYRHPVYNLLIYPVVIYCIYANNPCIFVPEFSK